MSARVTATITTLVVSLSAGQAQAQPPSGPIPTEPPAGTDEPVAASASRPEMPPVVPPAVAGPARIRERNPSLAPYAAASPPAPAVCPCLGPVAGSTLLWCPCPPPSRQGFISFAQAELPPDEVGPFVPGAESSSEESYEHMERAGTVMVLAGLAAGALGGVLLGLGLGSDRSSGGVLVGPQSVTTGLGAAFSGLGGLSILVGIPLAAVGSASSR